MSKSKAVIFPSINWGKLDCTPTLMAVAGDLAALIRKKIEQGEVQPQLSARTIKSKTRRGLDRPRVPLYATGMMRDHISHKKIAMNHVQIFIKDRRYGEDTRSKKSKNARIIRKSWKGGVGKSKATNIARSRVTKMYRATPTMTTNDVAYIHDRIGSGKTKVLRPFFSYTTDEFERVFKNRVKQSFAAAVRRVKKSWGGKV
jgi:hypothetical protein